jgi:RHS repeat-associated protein
MIMPGRRFSAGVSYRYGFNGKEEDDDVKGDGNQQDYGMRIYDPRLGRFLSVDPLTKEYPELTPYQFASNTPIQAIDLDGLEAVAYTYVNYQLYGSNGKLLLTKDFQVRDKAREISTTKDFFKWILTGESKQGISILYTRNVDRLGIDGKTSTETFIIGELYIPAKGDTKRGGFYFSAEGGGFGNSGGNSLSSGKNNMISISLLLSAAGFPVGGGEAENMAQFINIMKNGGKDFKKLMEAAEGTMKGINGAFDAGEKIRKGVKEVESMFKKGNVYYDEELGINLKRDSDTSGSQTNETAKDTLRNKKK